MPIRRCEAAASVSSLSRVMLQPLHCSLSRCRTPPDEGRPNGRLRGYCTCAASARAGHSNVDDLEEYGVAVIGDVVEVHFLDVLAATCHIVGCAIAARRFCSWAGEALSAVCARCWRGSPAL